MNHLLLAKILSDLNKCWTPHQTQIIPIISLFKDNLPIVFCENGRKWGKTELIAYFLWRRALTVPGGHYYLAPEAKQAREIIWATGRLQSFGPIEYLDGKPHDTEMRVKFKNGSFIKADGADNVHSLRGTSPHSVVFDEYRDHRAEVYSVMGPNLAVHKAPLLICSTPPETDLEFYDGLKASVREAGGYFTFPTWSNPHISRAWLAEEKRALYARGEGDVWEREYAARKVRGGKNAYFPMYNKETMVKPHDQIMQEIERDKKKLIWQIGCDPGNATVFAVLFRAINPFTKKVYYLDEIYEQNQSETSTSRIVPRIKKIRDELYPSWEAHGIAFDQVYDEAATWFATEALNSFGESFMPTRKAEHGIDQGISLLKDQMLYNLTVISDRCINLSLEIENFVKDPRTNKPHKACKDHAIDISRYLNSAAGIDLNPEAIPPEPEISDNRMVSIEQDIAQDRLDRGETDELEDF